MTAEIAVAGGTAAEIACDEAGYVTGAVLPVDGGRTAGVAEVPHVGMDAGQ